MNHRHRLSTWAASGIALLAALTFAVPAVAASRTCREWKTRVVRAYLAGAPQSEVDAALFELLQRESWLTACDLSVEGARAELVGWRLVGRSVDHYASAVLESVLAQGGFELDLRRWVAGATPPSRAHHASRTRGARGSDAAH